MKRVIAIALVVNAALLAADLLRKEIVVHAAASDAVAPAGNGDVNGDGVIDISDVVYLLSSQFLGGPAPVPIESAPPAGKELPATGQTKCYDNVSGQGWVEVPCEQARLAVPRRDASSTTVTGR
jgi:hypothetical protein